MTTISLSTYSSKLWLCAKSTTFLIKDKKIFPFFIASGSPASLGTLGLFHTSRWTQMESFSCLRGGGAHGNSLPHQTNHSSLCNISLRYFSTRRRLRGGRPSIQPALDSSSSDISKRVSANQDVSEEKFLAVGTRLLDQFEKSLLKLKDSNVGMEIARFPPDYGGESHGGRLSVKVTATEDLYWGGGTYTLTINSENKNVTLLSPLSGSFTYVLDVNTGEWVGSDDGHSLLGMFTRDWIRQCNGVPDF
ncbi:hypothetical protein ACHAXS_007975 [Conticribra weissflogii]